MASRKLLKDIKKYKKIFQNQSDDLLMDSVRVLKKKINRLNSNFFLSEWYAIVSEITYRKLCIKYFDTQFLSSIFLHQGKIIDMQTGGGKSLAASLAASFNSLGGSQTHIITINDHLATRDFNFLAKLYQSLTINPSLIKQNSTFLEKKNFYKSSILYTSIHQLIFDFLHDTSALYKNDKYNITFHYAIIDEVDSILLDSATIPHILSKFDYKFKYNFFYIADKIKYFLLQNDVKKYNNIILDKNVWNKIDFILGKQVFSKELNLWHKVISNVLKAYNTFKKSDDYLKLNNKICILDKNTGRMLKEQRWSFGLHEAIEIKEKIDLKYKIELENLITLKNFFENYKKISYNRKQ